jgi:hypothetical protein
MSKISMSNGASVVDVSDLSEAQIEQALDYVGVCDDGLRDAIHAQDHEDDRSFLAAYCVEHERRYNQVFTLP